MRTLCFGNILVDVCVALDCELQQLSLGHMVVYFGALSCFAVHQLLRWNILDCACCDIAESVRGV